MALFECEDISVDLIVEGTQQRIVNDVTFQLERGGIYDLMGASGSGKSTLLTACARLTEISCGTMRLSGRLSTEYDPPAWRSIVCLVPQTASLFAGTVRDNLLYPWKLAIRKGRQMPTDASMRDTLDVVLLKDVSLDRDAAQLSGGQAARVALVRAFLTKPDVLLLDEVDAALDDKASAAVSQLTQKAANEGAAILRIRHKGADGLETATFHMNNGRLMSHE